MRLLFIIYVKKDEIIADFEIFERLESLEKK
jgi:hypothetical protein